MVILATSKKSMMQAKNHNKQNTHVFKKIALESIRSFLNPQKELLESIRNKEERSLNFYKIEICIAFEATMLLIK